MHKKSVNFQGKEPGKQRVRKISTILLAFTCLTRPESVVAEIVPADSQTRVYNAPNNVPVVDIATPNASGLSHNRFNDYNIDNRGVVLNNGDPTQMARQSQLAGQVTANLNLVEGKGASLILNEVVSTKRSVLGGFTEVLGKTADVIVANPNGITCNGCGFINTPNVTLTTGTPNISGNGDFSGATVTKGDILITGTGLNADNQEYLALVARKIKIEGQLNGDVVDVVAGANTWDHATKTATANAPTGDTPDYAIDSSSVGGMYANRIRLIATEAGVGVKMLGDVAATGDDFTINSAGKIQVSSKLSAQRDLKITTTSNASDALQLTDANLTAQRDINANSTGGINISGSGIKATRNLDVTSASLTDAKSSAAITDNNKRYASGTLNIKTSGATSIDGTTWGSAGDLTGKTASLTFGSNGGNVYTDGKLSLTTTTGDMELNKAYVQSKGNMTLTASNGSIITQNGADQGIRVLTGELKVNASSNLLNAGTFTTDTGSADFRIGSTLNNSGTIHTKNILDIQDYVNGDSESIINSGTILSDNLIKVVATGITNSGNVQSAKGLTFTSDTLNNSGKLILSTDNTSSGVLNIGSVTNTSTGIIQSSQDIELNSGTINNDGKMIALDDLIIRAENSSPLTLTNTGLLQAADSLELSGYLNDDNLDVTTSGTIIGNNVTLNATTVDNSGTLQSENNIVATISDELTNSGTVISKNLLNLAAADIDNSGTIQGNKGALISGTGLVNTGLVMGSTDSLSTAKLTFDSIENKSTGVLQSSTSLDIYATNTFTNKGKVIALDDLLISGASAGSTLTIANHSGAVIQAADIVSINGAATGNNATLDTQAGTIIGDNVNIRVSSLTNSGTIQSEDLGSINVTNTFDNSGTTFFKKVMNMVTGAFTNSGIAQANQGGTMTVSNTLTNNGTIIYTNGTGYNGIINADTILNNSNKLIQAGGALTINLGTKIENAGRVLAAQNLAFRGLSSADYALNTTGRIQSNAELSIKGYGNTKDVDVTTSGGSAIILGQTADMNIDALTIGNNDTLTTAGSMTLGVNSLTFGGSGAAIVAATDGSGTATLTSTSALSNNAAIHSGYNLSINAPSFSVTNTGGTSALNNLTITTTAGDISNSGALYSGHDMSLTSNASIINQSSGTMDSGRDFTTSSNLFENNNDINIGRNGDISAAIFRNNVAGGDNREWSTVGNFNPSNGSDYTDIHLQLDYDEVQTDSFEYGYFNHQWNYEATWVVKQTYVGGKPTDKPNLIASNNLTIRNFDTGENIGGLISANVLTLVGNGGAVFTNNAMKVIHQDWSASWYDTEDCGLLWIDCDFYSKADIDGNNTFGKSMNEYVYDQFGAGMYANTINGGGFSLDNEGAPQATNISSTSASGASATSLSGSGASGASTVSGSSGSVGTTTVGGVSALVFGGLTITLPTNPNGYFVPSQNNNSGYLIESNPRFAVGANTVGSNYLAERLGVNPDEMQKRLGDANYEAYLVRKQLIDQSGRNLLNQKETEGQQMERLMNNGATQAKEMGLKLGQPLTPTQIAGLKEDMVWMVEVEVNGQKVLSPVVYLSSKTKSMFGAGDAEIAASEDMNLNLESLKNNGGTITAGNNMNITSKGDIENISGKMSGGNVNLQSTEGSIVNKTYTNTTGNNFQKETTVGKTATIEATNNLSLDAKKDITNLGAEMKAGNDANLKAGGNVTFDTIQDESASTERSGWGFMPGMGSSSETTTSTTKQIGSTLQVGGNLKSESGKDTTIGGSNVKVGGNADMKTGGSLNIVDREDSSSTSTKTKSSDIFSSTTSTKTNTTTTSKGSNIDIGGNLKTDSAKDTTIKGSDVTVGGNADIKTGGDLNILDGKNTNTSSESTSTTGLGKGGSGSIYGSETTTTDKYKQDSVGSNLKVGGNLKTDSANDTTIKGSNVEAKGNVDMKTGGDMKVLAGENIETTKTTTTKTGFGFMGTDSGGEAKSDAGAEAKNGMLGAKAGASANASAEGEGRLTLMRSVTETEETYDKTHTASTIKSGGDMKLDAGKDMKVVGSDIEAGGNADLKAGKNMTIEAAKDIHETKTSRSVAEAGLYAGGEAEAGAEASGQVMPGQAKVGASAEASAEGSVGLYVETRDTKNTEGSSTARVSTIKSGGDMSRKAGEKMTDEGTQIEAGGNYSQEAKEIDFKAAKNEQWSSSSSETNTGKIGAYAGASAGAGAKASTHEGAAPEAKAEAKAEVGIKASYQRTTEDESSNSSQAVTGGIKAGGNVSSKSSGKTTFEGTNIEAGGDGNIEAGELEFKAAKDTESSSSSSSDLNVEAKIGYGYGAEANSKTGETETKKGVTGGVSGGYETESENSQSSKAVVGSMKTGGNMNIKTKGDSTFEGTNLEAGKDANITSEEGSVNFNAARDTEKTSGSGWGVSAEIDIDKMGGNTTGGASVEGNYNSSSSESSNAVTGGVKAGGNMNVTAKKDINAEGTKFDSGGNASLEAKEGDINIKAAKSTSSSTSTDISAGIGGEVVAGGKKEDGTRDKNERRGTVGFEAGYTDENSTTNETGSITSGGGVTLKSGKNTKLEGTDIKAEDKVSVDAGGELIQEDAVDSSNSLDLNAEMSAGSNKNTGVYGDIGVDASSTSSRKSGSISGSNVEVKTGR